MELDHRQLLLTSSQNRLDTNSFVCGIQCQENFNPDGICYGYCFEACPMVCKSLIVDGEIGLPLPPPEYDPPTPPPPPRLQTLPPEVNKHQLIQTGLTIGACMAGGLLLLIIVCVVLQAYRKYRQQNSMRTRSTQILFGTQMDFLDQDQGPGMIHPIWYINTVGLSESVIDSIEIFKYRKGEGLLEVTDCSVCLTEFEEDESLRLLPKCSHAFHLPCIDTWLRSHKNCPFCRAPIMSDDFDTSVGLAIPSSGNLGSTEEQIETESSENRSVIASNHSNEGGSSASTTQDGDSFRLTTEDERIGGNTKSTLTTETEMQPTRRSMSLDSPSALIIGDALANIALASNKHGGALGSQLDPRKHSQLKIGRHRSGGNLSFRKLTKNNSIGSLLQKGPVSMKRSLSYGVKCSTSSTRHTRSRDSILPV